MHTAIKFKTLSIAISSLLVAGYAGAAGLDRSGQDSSAFLQDGTYVEAVYTYIDADVSGKDNDNNSTGDISEYYDYGRFGLKTDVSDSLSIGILYDQPFGAAVEYSGDSNFVSDAATAIPGTRDLDGTNVEINSYNLTGLVGMKVGDNFQVYGGPALQRLEGQIHLRGTAYGGSSGYDAHMSPDDATGWVAGAAFRKPEIGLRASLTYRSEIEHENPIGEYIPYAETVLANTNAPAYGLFNMKADRNGRGVVEITTPESYNVDFQTGINRTTLATLNVRYVPWGDFSVVPPVHNALTQFKTNDDKGLDLVNYPDDQWKVDVGLAKRLSPALAVSGSVGWDSGAGHPATSLGPVEGFYSVGAGAKYNFTPNWAVSAGAKYLMFGDAKGSLTSGDIVSDFEDNDGFAVGFKLSYQMK